MYNLKEYLKAIENNPEITLRVKNDHQVIDYNFISEDTFRNPNEIGISEEEKLNRTLRRDCRGLIFDMDGKLIRRPYHKFFNINEKEETLYNNLNFGSDHTILSKLDGSMIAPFSVNNNLYFGTRAGITDVSKLSENIVSKECINFINYCISLNCTPIFEFCSRANKIVIDYPEPKLILTAMREIDSGKYIKYAILKDITKQFNIDLVPNYEGSMDELYNQISTMKGIEGFVVRFNDGQMVKLKTEEYVLCHRSIDETSKPRYIVNSVLNNTIDDLKSFVDKTRLEYIKEIESILWAEINRILYNYDRELNKYKMLCSNDKKLFAVKYVPEIKNKEAKSLLLNCWLDGDVKTRLINLFEYNSRFDKRWEDYCISINLESRLYKNA